MPKLPRGKRNKYVTNPLAPGVNIYEPPKGVILSDGPGVYRRDLIDNWVLSKTTAKTQEIIELENLFKLLKGTTADIMYKKKMNGNYEFTNIDIAYLKLIKETLVDLNRLKYGDKKVNVNVGYDNIREMMFGKDAANPPSD